MKFIFDKAYSDAMEGLDNDEDDEKEMKINPNTVSAGDFKKFTCGFMFSTLKSMDLLNEMNTKLDQAISTNSATEEKVKKLEETVTKMEEALTLKDTEIEELTKKVDAAQTRMDKLDEKINILTSDQGDLGKLRKQADDIGKETLTLERYTRSFNLRMFNVPDSVGDKSTDVIQFVDEKIAEITGSDIHVEYGHRVGVKKDGKPRAVICRIASRQKKHEVMAKRGEFFRLGFPIYDDLPQVDLDEKIKHAAAMQQKWQEKQKVQFIRGKWYLNGQVYNG